MRLAHARGPLRDVLARLSARFAATQGWSRLGFARMSDYARERLGLSQRALQDFACIGARLDALPALREALQCGRLPWSKVRLLARFVEAGRGDRGAPEDPEEYERAWIAYAQARSVKTLERELRAVDRGALEAEGVGASEPAATDGEAKREWVRISAPRSLAFKWQRAKKQARRVAGAPLPPGDVLELVLAEVMAALPVRLEWDEEDREARARRSSASVEQETTTCDVWVPTTAVESTTAWIGPAVADASGKRGSLSTAPRASSHSRVARGFLGAELHRPPPEPPAFLSRLLHELDEADAFELDARLQRAVRLEQRLDSQIAPLVRVVMAAEYEWQGERPTMAALAREGLGMSPSKLRALLRIERVGSRCPALLEAYRDGALSWSQACVLAPLLDSDAEGDPRLDWRGRWVGFALGVTGLRLKRAVEHARDLAQTDPERFELHREEPEWFALASFGDGDDPRNGDKGDHGDHGDQVDAADERRDERQKCAHPTRFAERVRMTFQAPIDVARLFRAVTCTLRRAIERRTGQLPSVAEVFETMLTHALDSWGLDDPWLKKNMSRKYLAVLERDDWRCVFPGCTSQRNLHVHHIRFRSAGGGDEARNLTTLCAFHHLRGVHGGTARVEGSAPDGLEFALGLRAGREPLVRYRSGGRVVG